MLLCGYLMELLNTTTLSEILLGIVYSCFPQFSSQTVYFSVMAVFSFMYEMLIARVDAIGF